MVIVFGINFFWANRLPSKKEDLEKEYSFQNNLNPVQIQRFKTTKGYLQFLTTHEPDSLRHYLDQAVKEMNDSSNITAQ